MPKGPLAAALTALTVALLPSPLLADDGEREVQCYLEVQDEIIIDGRCPFRPLGDDGSFVLGSQEMNGYFAYVSIVDPGVAEASWNAEPAASHAHTPLGVLNRDGACWRGEKAVICARAL